MPLRKCGRCHHEWEGSRIACDWCQYPNSTIIMEKTGLEQLIELYSDKLVYEPPPIDYHNKLGVPLLYTSWFLLFCVVCMLIYAR